MVLVQCCRVMVFITRLLTILQVYFHGSWVLCLLLNVDDMSKVLHKNISVRHDVYDV